MADDSLPYVKNTSSNTALSTRVITPLRRSTPTAGRSSSNPRSSSATKLKTLSAEHQAQTANAGIRRSSSQRKRRQYENDNCHHLFKYFVDKDADDIAEEISAHDRRMNIHRSFTVDWRSTIGKLYENQDYDTLDLFRRCQDNVSLTNQLKRTNIKVPPHLIRYVDAHKAFINVEKRLRNIVYAAIKREPHLLDFISDWENLLLYFAENGDIPNQILEYPSLVAQLNSSLDMNDQGNILYVDLKDSRLARLMLHFVVKFYGCFYNVSYSYHLSADSTQIYDCICI